MEYITTGKTTSKDMYMLLPECKISSRKGENSDYNQVVVLTQQPKEHYRVSRAT